MLDNHSLLLRKEAIAGVAYVSSFKAGVPLRTYPVCAAKRLKPCQTYQYNGSEGIVQKATIEKVFTINTKDIDGVDNKEHANSSTPWTFGWQMNERNTIWTDDLKMRLLKRVLCKEMQVTEDDLNQRLDVLDSLLPGLGEQFSKAPPKLLICLLSDTPTLADRLLKLKLLFRKADVLSLISNDISILGDAQILDHLEDSAQALREMLPEVDVDKFVERFPCVLDVASLRNALEDAKRMMPTVDVQGLLRASPEMVMSLMKGRRLVPYDDFPNPFSS